MHYWYTVDGAAASATAPLAALALWFQMGLNKLSLEIFGPEN